MVSTSYPKFPKPNCPPEAPGAIAEKVASSLCSSQHSLVWGGEEGKNKRLTAVVTGLTFIFSSSSKKEKKKEKKKKRCQLREFFFFRIVLLVCIWFVNTQLCLSYSDTQIHSFRVFFAPYFIDGNIVWACRSLHVLKLTASCHGDFQIPHLGHEFHKVPLQLG